MGFLSFFFFVLVAWVLVWVVMGKHINRFLDKAERYKVWKKREEGKGKDIYKKRKI